MSVVRESVRAPAKVNLYLRIRGRRLDGYHLIDSVIAPISLCDDLHIAVRSLPERGARSLITVRCTSAELPHDARNLAYRAADAFMSAANRCAAVDIEIHKRIPIGSGLGGGSSDAAAVLLTLNRIFGRPLLDGQLADVGAAIGADVPFFIHGRPAQVAGIGDAIVPIRLGPTLNLVVCSDGFSLSTGLVYSLVRVPALSLTTDSAVSNIATFVEGRKPFTDLLVNDLEEAAAQIHPEVLSLKARVMAEGAHAALMTGSGSAVFGVWAGPRSAADAAMRLRSQGLWAEAVETLELSPALGN